MKTKVAIDISNLSQDQRGMGFFLREFLLHLSEVSPANFEFVLVSGGKGIEEKFSYPIIKAKQLDESWVTWFPCNCPTFKPPGVFVTTVHDLAPFVFPHGEAKLQKKFLQGARKAKKIVVDSEFIFQQSIEFLKVPPERLCVISPGFTPVAADNLPEASPWPYSAASETNSKSEDRKFTFESDDFKSLQASKLYRGIPWFQQSMPRYMLAVGPAEQRKNFERLLFAFARLKKQNFPHKLVILGELPPWRRRVGVFWVERNNPLPALARKLKLKSDIIFSGMVSRETLLQWYRNAALVVVPSLYEGFGYPVLEAYSCGVPLACSHAASLPEVAGDGAFYFNPQNPDEMSAVLYHALTDEKAVHHKKRFAEKQVQLFQWESCIRQYLEVFRSVASMS